MIWVCKLRLLFYWTFDKISIFRSFNRSQKILISNFFIDQLGNRGLFDLDFQTSIIYQFRKTFHHLTTKRVIQTPWQEYVLVLNLKAFKHISNRRWSKTRTDDGKMFHLFAEQKSVFKILLFCPIVRWKGKLF